ncbi:phage regulatory protein, Rha family [Solidesulfovibrio carbinoliphilus subsp. oakridgensis]|uniref:Phage regulatory protein, Rha family n=1 Tax=Solidesulfovibrio carbinoliphilus subsp. oakridgensis TaxID=694327 RepID=G7QB56_9BACT|nr:Rha family transcriptional regulator [Solidesulfovibrio carbinoliphilus]EHJ48798.1 phage regulatory protein, Rha family [Solidesulfovibrio carbinoliphilus subsp. oakridgensis]
MNELQGKASRGKGDLVPEVFLLDGAPVVTSLKVGQHFRKKHLHVLEAIRRLMASLPSEFNESNFRSVEYLDAKGERRPAYHLSRDGFTLLVMGFTGKKALAWKVRYIQAFNAMEKKLQDLNSPPRPELGTTAGEKERPRPELGTTPEEKGRPRFQFEAPMSMDLEKMEGIRGWLDYWCYIDDLDIEEAIQQLCIVLQVQNLNDLQESDTTCAYNFIWWSLFKIKSKNGIELTEKEKEAFCGLIKFWEKCVGEDYDNIIYFICTKCSIVSIEDIKQHSLQKAFNAVLLGIFRHVFCNEKEKVYSI